jgi:hypothetical protein
MDKDSDATVWMTTETDLTEDKSSEPTSMVSDDDNGSGNNSQDGLEDADDEDDDNRDDEGAEDFKYSQAASGVSDTMASSGSEPVIQAQTSRVTRPAAKRSRETHKTPAVRPSNVAPNKHLAGRLLYSLTKKGPTENIPCYKS